jgi:hypothetical protein
MKIDRQIVYDKYRGHCAYCGEVISIKDMQVDHIIPQWNFVWDIKNKFKVPPFLIHLTELDVNHIDNLLPTCRVCNKWKSAHSLDVFRTEIEEQLKRLNDYSSNYRIAKKYGLVKEMPSKITFYFERNTYDWANDPKAPWNLKTEQTR